MPAAIFEAVLGNLAVAAALAAVALAGCGGDDGPEELVVSAAASVKQPFTAYARAFDGARVRLSFAGSDELAAQIRQGAPADVFAAANTKLPGQLYEEGHVEQPVVFATNALVLAVPRGSAITTVDDLARRGLKLAIGAEGVPVGDYARGVLSRLGARRSRAILANVRSEEPDVGGIVGKLTQGAADAGFVYRTDVLGAGGRLTAITLPESLQADVQYGVAVVKKARNPEQARAFVRGLVRGAGAEALADAGFGRSP